MQWDEKELDIQFTPNVYFWTPNSEILAKALIVGRPTWAYMQKKYVLDNTLAL